jgi:hypothetical protein
VDKTERLHWRDRDPDDTGLHAATLAVDQQRSSNGVPSFATISF